MYTMLQCRQLFPFAPVQFGYLSFKFRNLALRLRHSIIGSDDFTKDCVCFLQLLDTPLVAFKFIALRLKRFKRMLLLDDLRFLLANLCQIFRYSHCIKDRFNMTKLFAQFWNASLYLS